MKHKKMRCKYALIVNVIILKIIRLQDYSNAMVTEFKYNKRINELIGISAIKDAQIINL